MVKAWMMDASEGDQREEHKQSPNVEVSLAQLEEVGVVYHRLDADSYETDPELQAIRDERGYSYQDIITVAKDTLPNYETKIKSFFEEHLHADEEVRYILDGSGYFDVRNKKDQWIRIAMEKGDLIVLPAGIYHRFTLDTSNYIKAMRLFVGEPIWTPHNRPQETHPARVKYLTGLGLETAESLERVAKKSRATSAEEECVDESKQAAAAAPSTAPTSATAAAPAAAEA